jgi:hypothetical protein
MSESKPYFDVTSNKDSATVALYNGGGFSGRIAIFRRGTSGGVVDHSRWYGELIDENEVHIEAFGTNGVLTEAITIARTKLMERWRKAVTAEDVEAFIAMEEAHGLLSLDDDDFDELRNAF